MTQLLDPPTARGSKRLYATRAIVVAIALAGWFWSQGLIGSMTAPTDGVSDRIFVLTASFHDYLAEHASAANVLLIVSSFCIDVLGIFLLARGIFGPTLRPIVGLISLFALRQLCQATIGLPVPPGMIWREPLPFHSSLLVTYGVANDFFFSGHTAIAVLGAVELARLGSKRWVALGLAIAVFEMVTVLVLRAHYTMDVFTGMLAALLMAQVAAWVAPACDRALRRLAGSGTADRRA